MIAIVCAKCDVSMPDYNAQRCANCDNDLCEVCGVEIDTMTFCDEECAADYSRAFEEAAIDRRISDREGR